MGLPSSSNSSNRGGVFREELQYNTSGGLSPDLTLIFENGKLVEYKHNEGSDVLKSLEKGVGSLFEELLTP